MLYVAIWIVCGLAAGSIYRNKGRSYAAAFLAGLVLGPIALILAAITPADRAGQERLALAGGSKKCPACAELVKAEATVCRFCGHRFA